MPEKLKGSTFEKFVPILLIITIALAFAVGVLWQKVQNLEGGKVSNATTSNQPSQPAPNGKLTSDQTKKVPAVSDRDHIRGSKDAQVLLIEYSDLECPFCKQFHPTLKAVLDSYGGKVAWVYRHFPLTFHVNAEKEAEASECASQLGGNDAFWKYVDAIFERTTSNGTGFALTKLTPLAGEIGLDTTKFQSCLDGSKFKDMIDKEEAEGQSAGVNGTPGTFVINKKGDAWLIPGALPFDSLKSTIDEALK